VAGPGQDVEHCDPEVRRAVVRLGQGCPRHAPELGDGRRDRGPAETRRPLVCLRERPAGQEDGRDRQLVQRQAAQVLGEQ
jgi:hypothetical protein